MSISKELLSEVLGLDVYEDDKKFSELLNINSISDNVNYNIRFLKDIENGWTEAIGNRWINTYELAFRTREYLKTKSKHLSLNQGIDDIFKEANDIYESLSK